jgi:hypothetical protein
MSNGEEDKERCTLLGGIFAATVQVFLGVVAIGALVYKRGLEDPHNRRFFDTWMVRLSIFSSSSVSQSVSNKTS